MRRQQRALFAVRNSHWMLTVSLTILYVVDFVLAGLVDQVPEHEAGKVSPLSLESSYCSPILPPIRCRCGGFKSD